MEYIQFFGYVGALAIGVVLGLMGSGGSLMAVPIFTYMFHINPDTTTAYSLFVVGVVATFGVLQNIKKGLVDFKIALVFALPCFATVYVVRRFLMNQIPDEITRFNDFVLTKDVILMLLLVFLMTLAAIAMLRKTKLENDTINHKYAITVFIIGGVFIGFFTALVGIGGGFLIIPILVLYINMPIQKAIATSLLIIALKSLIGFLGDINHIAMNWSFLLVFTGIAVLGIILGMHLATIFNGKKLKKYFAYFLIVLSVCIFSKEILFI